MSNPSPAWNEADRLKAIEAYDILDTPREEEFDDIVKMAAQACHVPISLISFVTTNRQWFKAEVGTGLAQTDIESSICSHAILQKDVFVVPDTTKDSRTKNNPLVTGDPGVRFYAGALLETPEGLPLGTVCILDYKPRTLTEQETNMLKALARQVMTQLELRRTMSKLRRALAARDAHETRISFLSRLTQKLSILSSPEELSRVAACEVGQFLRAQRCYFFEAIPPGLHTRILPDWCAAGETTLEGEHDLAVVGEPGMWQALHEKSAALNDVRAHPWTKKFLPYYQSMNIGAALIAPFCREGKWVCCLGVGSKEARPWLPEEQVLLEDVMARVWPLIERARSELALRESEQRYRDANTLLGDRAALLENVVQQRTQKLSETIAELEAFSYSISHDMRAPLRSMVGFAEILQQEHAAQLDSLGFDYLSRISRASRRMDLLIQDVLNFSRLSREAVHLQAVDTDALIREIIQSYPNFDAAGVDIEIVSPLPSVRGNQALLTQCLSNLLENGVKFVAQGVRPRIKVWSQPSPHRAKLFFKDNGIGISDRHVTRIFEIFQRVGREGDGTGIGLAIVRKAVEKMGGTVGLTSALGQGSTFWLDLESA